VSKFIKRHLKKVLRRAWYGRHDRWAMT